MDKKVINASKWSTATEVLSKLVAPITNMILARLLTPEIFGVVATLTMVTTFAEIFTDAGFQKYLVQHEFETEQDYNLSTTVAFWTNLVLSLTIWGAIAIFAQPIASLVGSAGHEVAIVILSAEIPLIAFSSIQQARFRRDFDFKKLFPVRMLVAAIPLFVTVPIAFIFRSYWALVIGILAKDIFNAVTLTLMSKWKPSFAYSFGKLKDMLSFSIWTILENITIWLSTNIGVLILRFTLGEYYLGLYKTTINTIVSYFNVIHISLASVMFSALSRCQNDVDEFNSIFSKFQRIIALIVFPLGVGIFVYNELATLILLGNQWTETAKFLGLRALLQAFLIVFSYYNSEAFRSKGKPHLSMIAQALYLIASIPILYYGASKNYETLTVCSIIAGFILIFSTSAISHYTIKIKFHRVLKNIAPQFTASSIMGIFGYAMLMISKNIAWQIASVLMCMMVYFIALLALFPKTRRELLSTPLAKKIMAKFKRKPLNESRENNEF